jgi:hypothetical protein
MGYEKMGMRDLIAMTMVRYNWFHDKKASDRCCEGICYKTPEPGSPNAACRLGQAVMITINNTRP